MTNHYVVANWKMNGSFDQIQTLMSEFGQYIEGYEPFSQNIIICPPAPYMEFVQNRLAELGWQLGAQDCSDHKQGAFTGQISANMLKDLGCTHVIIGHSERRQYCNETNALINKKLQCCFDIDLTPILCIGETITEYSNGKTLEIISTQIIEALPAVINSKMMIAYEPIWSIGTGKVPTNDEIENVHQFIKSTLDQQSINAHSIPILYGGSVNGDNATSIMSLKNVDGVLVGGASLKSDDFIKIIANL